MSTLWIEGDLGPIEIASAKSFLRLGHQLTIYSYGPLGNVPDGVRVIDAQTILPAQRVARYARNGSPALHANLFRYALLAKTEEVWTDLDVIAVKPFDFAASHIFGYEAPGRVNNAVLALPQSSPALRFLRQFHADSTGVAPHLTGFRRLEYRLLDVLTGGLPITRWPWGSLGPLGLTYALRQSGEISFALPEAAFYPIPFASFSTILTPGGVSIGDLPSETFAVHVWNKVAGPYLRDNYGGVPPKDSLLGAFYYGDC